MRRGLPAHCFCPQIDLLIFDGPPKPLDKNIVAPSPFSIHADRDVMFVEQVCKGKAGKLAALIGIEHLGLSITCQSLLDGLKTKRGIERDGYTLCENLAAKPVDNRGEIDKTACHRNVGDIHRPDLIGTFHHKMTQQIGIDFMAWGGF